MNKAPEAFRTISEVADELELPQHVLRFWESRFPQVRPMKRGGGRRYYRPDDVDLLRGIRHLLYGEGYTIRGVQRILREQGGRFVQTVWQEGAPQPERKPELDVVEGEPDEVAGAADLAAAEDAETAEPAVSVDGPGRSGVEIDPYGRREPSFGPVHEPPRIVPADAAVAAVREPVLREPVRESAVVERAEAVPLPPPGLSAADRERLGAVLAELEACRGLLAGALADSEPGP